MAVKLELAWVAGRYVICRLDPGDPVPSWARGRFVSVTRTLEELSVVCALEDVPSSLREEAPYALLRVAGTLELGLTGILLSIAGPLAAAGVPILAISTFDTDYLLIREGDRERAEQALVAAGHRFGAEADRR